MKLTISSQAAEPGVDHIINVYPYASVELICIGGAFICRQLTRCVRWNHLLVASLQGGVTECCIRVTGPAID